MADLFWFSDEQWALIAPLLPCKSRGVRRVDDRRVLSGIVHVLKSGGRWSDAPPGYGPKKTLYNRFVRWADKGIWEDIFQSLASAQDMPARLFIDATGVRAHRCAAGAKGGLWPMASARPTAAVPPRSTSPATLPGDPGALS